MLVGMILSVIWFALFVVGHVGLFHLRDFRRRSVVIVALFSAAVVGYIASSVIVERYSGHSGGLRGNLLLVMLNSVFFMFAMFILYMPFYYTIATSLSVQTLISVQKASGHEVSLTKLRLVYGSRELVKARFEAMLESGLLLRDDSEFRLTRRGRHIARFFNYVKSLWRLGPGG